MEAAVTVGAMIWGYDYLKRHIWGTLPGEATHSFTIISWYGNSSVFSDVVEAFVNGRRDLGVLGGVGKAVMIKGVSLFLGHVSVEVRPRRGQAVIVGLWPSGVQDDSNFGTQHPTARPSRETYYIDNDHAQAVLQKIAYDRLHKPTFAWLGRGGDSCASWAVKLSKLAGVSAGTIFDRYVLSLPKLIGATGE